MQDNGEARIGVLIVDDHPVVREGFLRFLELEGELEVRGAVASGEEAVRAALRLRPDVVLMDLVMPGIGGVEAIRRIKESAPDVRVIVMTSFAENDKLFPAIKAGADGYLLKDLLPELLFQQLRGLADGQAPLSRSMTGKLFQELARRGRPGASPAASDALSPREGQVLALVVDGYSNREIAADLGIARNTVKNHIRSILSKLGARNRAQAAALAVNQGLIRLPTEER